MSCVDSLLVPAGWTFHALMRLRAGLYNKGVLKSYKAALPVVSVGNLTFGGTGKTPVVAELAGRLSSNGHKVAVLTRGYGRRTRAPVVLRAGEVGGLPNADTAGDEPLELAFRLSGALIVVDADRVRGASKAVELGATVAVMDDGFQHLRLQRDVNVLLVDFEEWRNGLAPPPRGRLREPLSAIGRATHVFITRVRSGWEEIAREIKETLRGLGSKAQVGGLRVEPVALVRWGERHPLSELAGKRVVAVSGIARPGQFLAQLESMGASVVSSLAFPDHHRYTPEDLRRIRKIADSHHASVATTWKDAVKLGAMGLDKVWVVELGVLPADGSSAELMDEVVALMGRG